MEGENESLLRLHCHARHISNEGISGGTSPFSSHAYPVGAPTHQAHVWFTEQIHNVHKSYLMSQMCTRHLCPPLAVVQISSSPKPFLLRTRYQVSFLSWQCASFLIVFLLPAFVWGSPISCHALRSSGLHDGWCQGVPAPQTAQPWIPGLVGGVAERGPLSPPGVWQS